MVFYLLNKGTLSSDIIYIDKSYIIKNTYSLFTNRLLLQQLNLKSHSTKKYTNEGSQMNNNLSINNLILDGYKVIDYSSSQKNIIKDLQKEIILMTDLFKSKKDKKLSEEDKEILKSLIRSHLRYDERSKELTKELSKMMYACGFFNFYITRPYIMIHLPFDKEELGASHIDAVPYSGECYTIWINLNDRLKYKPLKIYPKSHNFLTKLFARFIKKISFSKIRELLLNSLINNIDIDQNPGSFKIWSSNLLHQGLLNTGDGITVSLVYRLSKNPFLYEPITRISDIKKRIFKQTINKFNFYDQKIIKLFDVIKVIIKESNSDSLVDDQKIMDLFETIKFKKMNLDTKMYLSFALSILPQRIKCRNAQLLDLISIVLYKDNLISLSRINSLPNRKTKDLYINFIKKRSPFNSYQENKILGQTSSQPLNNLSW